MDNIVKPILDSLKGLVYQDDSQITDLISRRRPLAGLFRIEVISPILAEALNRGRANSCMFGSRSLRRKEGWYFDLTQSSGQRTAENRADRGRVSIQGLRRAGRSLWHVFLLSSETIIRA